MPLTLRPTVPDILLTFACFTCGTATPLPKPVEPFCSRLISEATTSSTASAGSAPDADSDVTSSRNAPSRSVDFNSAMIASFTMNSLSFMMVRESSHRLFGGIFGMLAIAEFLLVIAELTLQLVHTSVHPGISVRVVVVGDEEVAML